METDNTTVRYKRSVKLVHNESIPGQWSLNTPIDTIQFATVRFVEHPGETPTINTSTDQGLFTEIRLGGEMDGVEGIEELPHEYVEEVEDQILVNAGEVEDLLLDNVGEVEVLLLEDVGEVEDQLLGNVVEVEDLLLDDVGEVGDQLPVSLVVGGEVKWLTDCYISTTIGQ